MNAEKKLSQNQTQIISFYHIGYRVYEKGLQSPVGTKLEKIVSNWNEDFGTNNGTIAQT